jgi:hypothetical protein
MTEVIHIKDAPEGWMRNPQYVYIGRAGAGFDGTWGNPIIWRFPQHRQTVVDLYKRWLYKQDVNYLRKMYAELWGKALVCFCKPKLCHGDVIKEFVEGPFPLL